MAKIWWRFHQIWWRFHQIQQRSRWIQWISIGFDQVHWLNWVGWILEEKICHLNFDPPWSDFECEDLQSPNRIDFSSSVVGYPLGGLCLVGLLISPTRGVHQTAQKKKKKKKTTLKLPTKLHNSTISQVTMHCTMWCSAVCDFIIRKPRKLYRTAPSLYINIFTC